MSINSFLLGNKADNDIKTFLEFIKDLYRDNLMSVILFGSYAKKNAWTASSDIDILIVLKNAPTGLKRYKSYFDSATKHNFIYNYDVIILPLSAFNVPRGLMFDIAESGIALYDPQNIFKKINETTMQWLKRRIIEKKNSGGHFYWRINDAREVSGGLL
ncbi:MAG: nucleotidyltransferase domain-containing protein [Deltaproteobacteria bacterium]|nr:nucleotidyltransferase domain-containing protein [Deltaproteobacteria bacterium]MCL5891924.1 nucleotidyltransferase domain-containing protein [Deltaproteobacteria bacterium]